MMDYISCNDKRFWAASDAQTIQNAIDFAKSEHIHEVVIPHRNARTGEEIWHIDQNIVLPAA